ncbi:MAG: division/cell wall cluster transcriptional repressor MraZ [bacterium]|nr:division/cell wall cluster transcriptional repressor MraZ [bacterium]
MKRGTFWCILVVGGKKWGKVGKTVDNFSKAKMFIGEYHHSIDEKGRLALPTKFRKELAQGIVVTRGLDHCLFVYTQAMWEKMAGRIGNLPMNQKNNRAFARLMLAGAMDSKIDGQGRVVLPDYLRTFGGLTKNVVVAGVQDRLEIWDEAEWARYTKDAEQHSEEIAEAIELFQNEV